jgi:hypothetical protein
LPNACDPRALCAPGCLLARPARTPGSQRSGEGHGIGPGPSIASGRVRSRSRPHEAGVAQNVCEATVEPVGGRASRREQPLLGSQREGPTSGLEVVRHPSAQARDQLSDEVEHELKLHVLRFACKSRPQQLDRRAGSQGRSIGTPSRRGGNRAAASWAPSESVRSQLWMSPARQSA